MGGAWAAWRAATVAILLLAATPGRADWDEMCPPGCRCAYSSNRKMADCPNAGFSTVPTTLSPEVQELNLADNQIIYLEKDAFSKSGLVNLQKLYLNRNRIRSINQDAFRGLRIMIELDLSENRIDKLHPHTFTGLEKLRVLDLSLNLLTRLNGVQFPPLPHLRNLYFRENRLNYIHNFAFSNLNLLHSLRLSGNQLSLIQPDLFLNNTKLVELELHDNLWNCDCRLKGLVRWVKSKKLLQKHVMCHSPERLSGDKWEDVSEDKLACRPELLSSQTEQPALVGQNASLMCQARGEPPPQVQWVWHGRVISNMSVIPQQRYVTQKGAQGEERWAQLTIINITPADFTYYTCVANNVAGLVEQNVSLVAAAPTLTGAITPKTNMDLYIIIAIAAGSLLLLIIIIVTICCCVKRKKRRSETKPRPKVNGVVGGNHIEHKNVLVVNPVEKPPRKYEKVPQTDVEMTALNPPDPGAHRSYDEVDYPEAGPAPLRTPLATLEEEEDDLPSHDTTLPLDSMMAPQDMADYIAHYPDLLDMTRPRAVSPTQLSYHSVITPQFTTPEYRYSYVHPADMPSYPSSASSAYVAAYPLQSRPGYVTLPRRHRSPSWAGHPSSSHEESTSPPPLVLDKDGKPVRFDPIYDTLGPRTTADGTSRTDLTRPALRAAEPFTPQTPQSPKSPPSLPPYYTPLKQSQYQQQPSHFSPRNHQSATLPRSTPNLLEGGGLSLPQHETPIASLPTSHDARLTTHSPTPSTASTLRTASPAYRITSPHHQTLPINGHNTSNDSALDASTQLKNNNNNSVISKNDISNSNMTASSPGTTLMASGKKVPPKPPPKPSSKRLSVSSTSSDTRKPSLTGGEGSRHFQDEGPDGTEV